MTRLNYPDRTLALMDNLPFLRSMNNACIDLIAMDPPFAANETFRNQPKPPISEQEFDEEVALAKAHGVAHHEGIGQTRVKDVWNWDSDTHPAWKALIQDDYPEVFRVIEAVESCASENEAAYLCYMTVRLIECRRVLKDTGTLWLHCDNHANSYLRALLDAVFGAENCIDTVIWNYGTPSGGRTSGKKPVKTHDTLLVYAANYGQHTYNRLYTPYSENYVNRWFRHTDETGRRYRTRSRGGVIIRQYLDESPGVPLSNTWTDIMQLYGSAGWFPTSRGQQEITGYATQKPLALYERIVSISSNPGDVVLDPFAGCATTCVAAERLGRRWLACDMAYRSWTMLKRRFYLNGFGLADMTDSTREALGAHTIPLQEFASVTIGPNDLPARDDEDPIPFRQMQAPGRRPSRGTQTASWSGTIPKDEAKRLLIDRFGPVCWGCGYEPRRPNGTLDETLLEVDHIRARNPVTGVQGDDELYNLALLHPTCNRVKRNKMTLEELRQHNTVNALLYVESVGQLVDVFAATQYAHEQILARRIRQQG